MGMIVDADHGVTRALTAADVVTALLERKPRVLPGAALHLAGLLQPETVTYLLRDAIPDQEVRLVDRGSVVDGSLVTNGAGVARLRYCWERFESGHTIVLNQIRRRLPAVDELCLSFEQALAQAGLLLRTRVSANAYVAPARGDSFGLHSDAYSTLLVQTRGSKRWQVYERVTGTRAGKLYWLEGPQSPLAIDEVLESGDAIFIPYGCAHHGVTAGAESYHITLGFPVVTAAELFEDLIENGGVRFPYCRLQATDAASSLGAIFDALDDVGVVAASIDRLAERSSSYCE
jgi:Cupin superfamily protein